LQVQGQISNNVKVKSQNIVCQGYSNDVIINLQLIDKCQNNFDLLLCISHKVKFNSYVKVIGQGQLHNV